MVWYTRTLRIKDVGNYEGKKWNKFLQGKNMEGQQKRKNCMSINVILLIWTF